MGDSIQCLHLIASMERRFEKKAVDRVVGGMNHVFDQAFLRAGVGTQESQMNHVRERARGGVVKLMTIVALECMNRVIKLGGDRSKKSVKSIGLQLWWKSPKNEKSNPNSLGNIYNLTG